MSNDLVTRRGLLGSSFKTAAEWVGPNLGGNGTAGTRRLPVVLSLCGSHDDAGDALDLACLYGLSEADLRGVIVEPSPVGMVRGGFRAVHQLNYLSGRSVPALAGLPVKLRNPEDRAFDQPAESQAGVNFLLSELERSTEKVTLVATGSGRDLAVAYSRAPKLVASRCRALYLFSTEPAVDLHASATLLRATLPVHVVSTVELAKVRLGEVLSGATDALLRYLQYHLRKEQGDPIAYLLPPLSAEERSGLLHWERQTRAGALLGLTLGRRIVMDGHDLLAFDSQPLHHEERSAGRLHRLGIRDRTHAQQALAAATADLLTRFPLRDTTARA